jgi:ribonuclease HII
MIDLDELEKDCRDYLYNKVSWKVSTAATATICIELITEIRKLREANSVMKEALEELRDKQMITNATWVEQEVKRVSEDALSQAAQIMGDWK